MLGEFLHAYKSVSSQHVLHLTWYSAPYWRQEISLPQQTHCASEEIETPLRHLQIDFRGALTLDI